MKINQLIHCSLLIIFLFSCSSKKDILYLQDFDNPYETQYKFEDHLIKVGDVLKIDLRIENESAEFINQSNFGSNELRQSLIFKGYNVDSSGNINFPSIGKVKVEGKTLIQVRDMIILRLSEEGIYKDPTIDVKLLNRSFTIIGEVNKPGNYFYDENNFNLLQAIGYAEDLTIQGTRNDIKVIREVGNEKKVFSIDLTKSDFFNSPAFQIKSKDIIIVNPNASRVKNAGIIGNSGTLLSLLSFLLSSIIVITNN